MDEKDELSQPIPKDGWPRVQFDGCVPTVLDRFIQQAVMQVLQADWDGTFSEMSFGFRPGRSAHQAVEQAQAYIATGHGRFAARHPFDRFRSCSGHAARVARKAMWRD